MQCEYKCNEVIGMETNIVKEIQLGPTKIKFCNDYMANTKAERERTIREFKQASLNLINKTTNS